MHSCRCIYPHCPTIKSASVGCEYMKCSHIRDSMGQGTHTCEMQGHQLAAHMCSLCCIVFRSYVPRMHPTSAANPSLNHRCASTTILQTLSAPTVNTLSSYSEPTARRVVPVKCLQHSVVTKHEKSSLYEECLKIRA